MEGMVGVCGEEEEWRGMLGWRIGEQRRRGGAMDTVTSRMHPPSPCPEHLSQRPKPDTQVSGVVKLDAWLGHRPGSVPSNSLAPKVQGMVEIPLPLTAMDRCGLVGKLTLQWPKGGGQG